MDDKSCALVKEENCVLLYPKLTLHVSPEEVKQEIRDRVYKFL